jgi:hypothetical protein
MLKVGDIFEVDGDKWVVLDADSFYVKYDKYDMFTLGEGELEYSYLASRISKTGKPLKSMWRFSSESGATHQVDRNQKAIGKASVDVTYFVSNVRLDSV